ncbi:hypothetical protein BD770DRAFT_413143 [Pilaira anomala]|nr:hypothetical protein BD770DRAFT_413143 [Pilaira anomala]
MPIKNHHLTSTNNQYNALLRDPKLKDDQTIHADGEIINFQKKTGSKKHLFRGFDLDESKIVGLISPEGDGNCGFRAVSLSVYGNQGQCIQPCTIFNHWFDVTMCPQTVADTYKRPVVAYMLHTFHNKKNELIQQKAQDLYLPLCDLDFQKKDKPIIIYLNSNHFYLVELGLTPGGKPKRITYPEISCLYHPIIQSFLQDCSQDYTIFYK